jgi:hypothetical protein
MLFYIHFVDRFIPASKQEANKSYFQSDQSHIEMHSDLKRKAEQALTEQLRQSKTNYSLERRLFW